MLARFTAAIGKYDETEEILREAQRLTAAAAEDAAAKTRIRNNAASFRLCARAEKQLNFWPYD